MPDTPSPEQAILPTSLVDLPSDFVRPTYVNSWQFSAGPELTIAMGSNVGMRTNDEGKHTQIAAVSVRVVLSPEALIRLTADLEKFVALYTDLYEGKVPSPATWGQDLMTELSIKHGLMPDVEEAKK